MILSREQLEGGSEASSAAPHRITLFETDAQGRCEARRQPSEYDDLARQFYSQRREELVRLLAALRAGRISPIGFFLEHQLLTPRDLATRARVSRFTVRAHLTPKGFARATVEILRRYARVFDVDVADFFQVLELAPGLEARVSHLHDRLLQDVAILPGGGGGTGEGHAANP